MNVHAIRRSVGHLLCPLIVVAWGFCCGRQAAAQAVSPTLIVSLVQQSTGIASPGLQTQVLAALNVSGSLPAAFPTSGFGTLLSWTTSSPGVSGTNLYTVNASGSPSTTNTSMIADTPGFLYADFSPDSFMLTDSTTARNIAVSAFQSETEPFWPELPAGQFSDITIMQVRFGVSPGITSAVFNFTFNGSIPTYGFTDGDLNPVAFQNGGGSVLITPEPDAMTSLFIAAFATGGWGLMRRRVSRRLESIAAT